MADFGALVGRVIVFYVQGVNTTNTHHRMPHQRERDVFDTGVLVLFQMREHRRRAQSLSSITSREFSSGVIAGDRTFWLRSCSTASIASSHLTKTRSVSI
jgi:hypothetical protein